MTVKIHFFFIKFDSDTIFIIKIYYYYYYKNGIKKFDFAAKIYKITIFVAQETS